MNTITPVSHRPHWRKMTWALIIWTGIILSWIIAGSVSASNKCAAQVGNQYLSTHDAVTACQAGAGVGVVVILVFGFLGFITLSIIWFMSRPRSA